MVRVDCVACVNCVASECGACFWLKRALGSWTKALFDCCNGPLGGAGPATMMAVCRVHLMGM